MPVTLTYKVTYLVGAGQGNGSSVTNTIVFNLKNNIKLIKDLNFSLVTTGNYSSPQALQPTSIDFIMPLASAI